MSLLNEVSLGGLTTRESVTDAFYRIMSGFDDNSEEMLKSGMTENIVLVFNGKEVNGFDNVKKTSFDTVGPMDTTHFVTNARVHFESDFVAILTANTLAQHYPTGQGTAESNRRILGGSRHRLSVVKDKDGLWKVKRWIMHTVWSEGDRSVLPPIHGPKS